MRRVYVDPEFHYQFRKEPSGDISLVEYTTPGDDYICPKMGQRAPFRPDEGKVIETFVTGEKVEFIYSSYPATIDDGLLAHISPLDGENTQTQSLIHCGDDLTWVLRRNRIKSENDENDENEDVAKT